MSKSTFDPSQSYARSDHVLDKEGHVIDFGITLVARKPARRINLNAPPRKLKTRLNYFDGIKGVEKQLKLGKISGSGGNYRKNMKDLLKN